MLGVRGEEYVQFLSMHTSNQNISCHSSKHSEALFYLKNYYSQLHF